MKPAILSAAISRWPLIVELTKREVKLRYRGTWFGFLWSLLNPLVFMLVYTLVFSYFLRIGIPRFPPFLLTGLLAWQWLTDAVSSGTNCLVDHAGFLRNAMFPAEVLPMVSVATGMVNYIFSLPVLLVLLGVYGIAPSWPLLVLPVVMLIHYLLALGIVYFTSTWNVFFRDLRYIVQHILMVAFFLSPIMYDLSIVPERFQWILRFNPLTILIDSYRRIFFYGAWPHWRNLGLLLAFSLLLVMIGYRIFRANKEVFAEYL